MIQPASEAKLLSMLGFAKRAGKLITGCDLVSDAVRKNAGKSANHTPCGVVLIASDALDNTVKRTVNCCTHYHTPCYTMQTDKDGLSTRIGKLSSVSVVGVFDREFASTILRIIEDGGLFTEKTIKERSADDEN